MRKRQTVADRAYLADIIRSIDTLTADTAVRRWKNEAEVLLDVLDNDEHEEDLISTCMFYGFLRGIEKTLCDMGIAPFDDPHRADGIQEAWKRVMREYLAEMKKGGGSESVDY